MNSATRQSPLLLVTGASGMIGSFVCRRAVQEGYAVRALVRPDSNRQLLNGLDVEFFSGDLGDHDSFPRMLSGVDVVVHAGARIGDQGRHEDYFATNVVSLEYLLTTAAREGRLRRWVQVSSLGVYAARHHFGTDETELPPLRGLDPYTTTKAQAEVVVRRHADRHRIPAVILRPGFTYGPGERHVIPRLIRRFESGSVRFIGDGERFLNNTSVHNFVDAVFLAIGRDEAIGGTFNIRDGRLVTRREYLTTVAEYLGKDVPGRVPLWLARAAVPVLEGLSRLRRSDQPPLLSRATIKFMALNLDFSIDQARRVLGYEPRVDFQDGMREALAWATGTGA